MGKFVTNVILNKFRHPISKDPQPGTPIFVDVKDKDLPYDGQCKRATPSIFDHPLGLKQEGALLMAILTGVQGSALGKATKGAIDLYYARAGDEETTPDPSVGPEANKETKKKKRKKLGKVDAIKNLLFGGALSTSSKKRRSRVSPRQPHPSRQPQIALADAAVDTADLEELTGDDSVLESSQLLAEIANEEEVYKKSLELEASLESAIPLDEYLKLVKRSTGRIGYRTQLLDELALGEDIDMWVKDSEFPPVPPPPTEKSKESRAGDLEKSKETKSADPGAKPSPEYKGAMRATSLVVKKARRLELCLHVILQRLVIFQHLSPKKLLLVVLLVVVWHNMETGGCLHLQQQLSSWLKKIYVNG